MKRFTVQDAIDVLLKRKYPHGLYPGWEAPYQHGTGMRFVVFPEFKDDPNKVALFTDGFALNKDQAIEERSPNVPTWVEVSKNTVQLAEFSDTFCTLTLYFKKSANYPSDQLSLKLDR